MTYQLTHAQRDALAKCRHAAAFAFYLEQGLGKTSLALWEFVELLEADLADVMLVVAPSTFKAGWAAEVEKHGFPLETHVYKATAAAANEDWLRASRSKRGVVLVMNFESIRGDKGYDFARRFVGARRDYVVIDEAIQIATHNAQQTKAVLQIGKTALFRRLLSGRPQRSGPHDYWSQFRFLGTVNEWSYYAWRYKFCVLGGFKGKAVIGAQNSAVLARLMEPFTFFASKTDYSDLPPKVYTSREYELGPVLQRHYKSMQDDFVAWLDNEGDNVAVDVVVAKYVKLAQIQAGYIIQGDKTVELVPSDSNPRLRLLKTLLAEEVQGKATIPYVSRYSGEALEKALAEYQPAYIRGGMKPDEIEEQKARFNTDAACRVILLQTRAAKYGHTLLGGAEASDCCATTIFYENTYAIDDRVQIEDRNHRIGQQAATVLYIDLVGTPLDSMMIAATQRKEQIFAALREHITGRVANGAAD